jgi:hypothetical protein
VQKRKLFDALVPARQTLAVALVVWVDGWQMQCCGTPFAVGSRVAWTLGEADRDWLETVLSTDVQQTVDMAEDHHGALPADARQTRATVIRIRAVRCRYASRPGHDPRTLYPVSGSGVLSTSNRQTAGRATAATCSSLATSSISTPTRHLRGGHSP